MGYEAYVEFNDIMSMNCLVERGSSRFIELRADNAKEAASELVALLGKEYIRTGSHPDEVRLFQVLVESELTGRVDRNIKSLEIERDRVLKARAEQKRAAAATDQEDRDRKTYESLKVRFG